MSPMFVIRVLSSGQDTLPIVPLERQPVLMTIHGFRLNIFYLLVQKAVGFVVWFIALRRPHDWSPPNSNPLEECCGYPLEGEYSVSGFCWRMWLHDLEWSQRLSLVAIRLTEEACKMHDAGRYWWFRGRFRPKKTWEQWIAVSRAQDTMKPDEEEYKTMRRSKSVGLLLVPRRLGYLCSRGPASLIRSVLLWSPSWAPGIRRTSDALQSPRICTIFSISLHQF